jgi:superfamily II DNA or RNA helicase
MDPTINKISEKHKKLLLTYQINNVENIIRNVTFNKAVLDASDTGTGKTYTAICAVATLKFRPIIVCPKSVVSVWKKVCDIFSVIPFFIVNYETLINCKYYDKSGKRVKCQYIKYSKGTKKGDEKKYIWNNLPPDVIFIFDEAHRCSGLNTYNAKLLIASKDACTNGIIILSATIADNYEKFRIFFYILNFISQGDSLQKLSFKEYMNTIDRWISRAPSVMLRIHNMLFPNRCTRMNIDLLGSLFPETQIIAQAYTMGKTTETKIEYEYKIIYEALNSLKGKSSKDRGNYLVKILRSHQRIELLKVPTFVEMTREFIEEGKSVVIFVNYTQTLKAIADILHTNCLIFGEQTDDQRQYNINSFQTEREFIIICNIKAGGVGVSLHDINGKRKRAAILSPCWSAIDLVQALGRVHRAGSKSKSLQRIVYCAGTIEEKIAEKLQIKLKDIRNINDGDVNISNIIFEKKPIGI